MRLIGMSLFSTGSGVSGQDRSKRLTGMTSLLVDNWIIMALGATGAWALSCIVDVCFVGNGIYRKASDGTLIAGIFCLVPAVLTGFWVQLDDVTVAVAAVSALSGLAFLLHVDFFFRALFSLNDAVNAEIFNTLGVVIVPVLAFMLLEERLTSLNYVAIAVAAAGILILVRFQLTRMSWPVVAYLGASVLFASLMMVMQAWVLAQAGYVTVVFLFSSGAFIAVLAVFAVRRRDRQRVVRVCRRFGVLFASLQLLEIAAVLGSQRATDVGPSVSLVALLECSLPVFVMLFSWLFVIAADFWGHGRAAALRSALALQTVAAPPKVVSLLMIVFAIFLIQV